MWIPCRHCMTVMKCYLNIVKRPSLFQSQPRSKIWWTDTIKLSWTICRMILKPQMFWMVRMASRICWRPLTAIWMIWRYVGTVSCYHVPRFEFLGIVCGITLFLWISWLIWHLLYFQKLQQKLEQEQKKKHQKKQQQKQQQTQKQPEDYIQGLIALETEIKDKLSVLGLMPPSSLSEVLKPLSVYN